MNPEISQNQESSPIQVTDALPNPENQNSEMSKNSSELKKFSPESIDQVKIRFQPIKDKISTIDSIYQNALGVQTSLNNDSNIIIEEIPQTKITKKIVTTTKTVIKNGKETTTTTKKEETFEENNEKNNNGNISNKVEEITINNNNEIKGENKDNVNINDNNIEESHVTFGAPEQNNAYNSMLDSSNVTFGFNNSIINNMNKPELNNNNSNISDSNDKSSEQSNNIIIETKKENDNNNNLETKVQVNFGFKGDNTKENNNKEIKLVEKEIKFGYVPEKKEEKEEKNDEMELEPGEIKNENKEEHHEEKKEPIFTQILFDNKNNNNQSQGQSSIFEQKLFKIEEQSADKNGQNIINLFPDKKINNSIFDNTQNTQETFLKNNSSLIPQQNSEMPSAIFGVQNNPNENQNAQKTLNDMIKEGDVYNADSAQKTQANPTINLIISSPDNNTENNNTTTNIITNPILIQSMNKGKNPFKPNEPENIQININSNNTNDNIDTNESTMNRININMENNDKKISSPLANLSTKDQSKWFIQGNPINNFNNEIKVNPIFTSYNNTNPFNSILNNNSQKEDENKNYKSSLFPGLEIIKTKSESTAFNNNEKKIRSNPVFPGGIDLNPKKTKSNLFVEDTDKNKNKEENNNSEPNGSTFLSKIISDKIPDMNNNSQNKPEDKKEESNKKETKEESKINSEPNSSDFLSGVISSEIPKMDNINQNKSENKKEENKQDINNSNDNNNIEQMSSIIIPKDNTEKEKEKENIPQSINTEPKKEEIISNNKAQEIFSENKENENPKENELAFSNILNSNISNNNNINQDEEKKKENSEIKNSLNESQNQQKPRKSLFGDLFTQNNETNLDDILSNKNKSSNLFDSNNQESIFGNFNNNINNNKEKEKEPETKEPENIYTNNQGKNIFNSYNNNFQLFGKSMSPIKLVDLNQAQNKENINTINTINNNNPEQKEEKDDEEISIDIKAENGENGENDEEKKDQEESEEKKENSLQNSNNQINNKDNVNDIFNNESGNIIINIHSNQDFNNQQKILDNDNIKPETNFAQEEDALSEDEKEYNTNEITNKENIESNPAINHKPLNRKVYTKLIEKLFKITDAKKNEIDIPEKKTVTLYDNTLSKFLNDFEEKIKGLKNIYKITILKWNREKGNPQKQNEIITEANLPKKRNELKKLYRNMMDVIKNKLQKENQKYYYIQILKILDKYKKIIITKKENEEQKKLDEQSKERENKEKLKDKNIKNKNGKSSIINIAIFLIPLAYFGWWYYSNSK